MTATLPTPADIPQGHVVRVRCGGYIYTGPVVPAAEAEAVADKLDAERSDVAHRDGGGIRFRTGDGRLARIVARSISAIESGPPPAYRDRKAERPVIVNLHLSGTPGSEEPSDLPLTDRVISATEQERSRPRPGQWIKP